MDISKEDAQAEFERCRRLQGYPYRHNQAKTIFWWDTCGQPSFPACAGGEWHLIPDNEVGMFGEEACLI